MDVTLALFYLKRHLISIISLIISFAVIVMGLKLKAEFGEGSESAVSKFEGASSKRDQIQNSKIKVDPENVAVLNDALAKYEEYLSKASTVFSDGSTAGVIENNFLSYLTETVVLLNKKATNNLIGVPKDFVQNSDIDYSFTFGPLLEVADVSENKIAELRIVLKDVKDISEVLIQSNIRSVELIRRNRVTQEDFQALNSLNYLDQREKYTNAVSVVRPYRVRFRCLSEGIARVLSGLAKEETFFVVRSMEVVSATGLTNTDDGMSEQYPEDSEMQSPDGFPPQGGGVVSEVTKIQLPLPYINYLVAQGLTAPPATNVVVESLLEVVMDLDTIRKQSQPVDENNEQGQ